MAGIELLRRFENYLIRGKYRPGDRIPGEQELATHFGVSRGTMREATKLLKQQLKSLPHLRKLFTDSQLKDIENERERIDGKIWHHYEELSAQGYPIMQLVDERLHSLCKHTGGSYTWNPKHYPL